MKDLESVLSNRREFSVAQNYTLALRIDSKLLSSIDECLALLSVKVFMAVAATRFMCLY